MNNDEIELLDIYRVLREDWYWIVGITAAFAVITIVVSLLATEIYRAEAVVAPVGNSQDAGRSALARQFGGLAGLAGIDISGLSGGTSQLATPVLQSRQLAEEFILQNDLVSVLLDGDDADEPPSLWRATRRFMNDVRTIDAGQVHGLITVAVEWTDPVVAAEWANGLVALANEQLRQRELTEAERNIAYLNEQITQTNVVGMQQAMFNLIESEMKTVMMANAREEYAFAIVDPAVPPELRERPKRKLMVILGTMLGGFLSLMFVGFRRLYLHLRAQEATLPG